MEGCLLCLEINKEFTDSIAVNSTKWEELKIKNIIEKHFWSLETLSTSWLCIICWQELYDFHKFYIRIEEAHTEFSSVVKNKIETHSKDVLQNNNFTIEKENKDLFSLHDLNESHYEPEISIHDSMPIELVVEEEKPTIKEEIIKELCKDSEDSDDDDIPLTQRRKRERRSKDSINYMEESNEDPLNESEKSKKSKTANTKTKKTKPSPKKATISKDKNDEEISEIKQDPDLINMSEEANNSDDLPDMDNVGDSDDTDSNYEPDEKSLEVANKKKSRPTKRYAKTPKTNRVEHNKFLNEHFKLSCILCKLPMETFKVLRKHFEVVHKTRGYVICCNRKFFRRSVIIEHIQRHLDPTDFKCQQCGKVMGDRRRLELHIKAHEGKVEKNHFCDICNKAFNTSHALKTHKMIHLPEEERLFPCSECGKNFGNNYLLSKHVRSVHLKKNTLICYICGRSIRDKQAFERHMLEHEGKPAPTISCEICGLRVVNKDGLKRHKAVKHPVGGKQEHICPICSKVSPNIKAHRSHVSYNHKMGRDHKCTICEKAFKKAQALTEHMASHTGDVLYTCPWCPKTFNSSSYMHNHRKKSHPKEYEAETRKKYSGNLPPNFKHLPSTNNVNDYPIPLNI